MNNNRFDEMENFDAEIPSHVANYLCEVRGQKIKLLLDKYFQENSMVLKGIDIGCGTGNHIAYLQEIIPTLEIDGLDYSKKMLELAEKKGLKNNFIHSSMTNIQNIQNETYDFAFAVNSLHHLSSKKDQLQAIKEVLLLLKKGGIFIIHEINIKNPVIRFYMDYVFPNIRNIDDGSEVWLTEETLKHGGFDIEDIDYFTFVPDFTPSILMPVMVAIDKLLSKSPLSLCGAHIMFVLRKRPASR
ncbi:MAG: class I SAM-dependent methyltransferase [Candidatus Electrothrix sp. AW3_4]|nr:class I SAM-dependent methyltransferase [Candidatus Electrothrix gigas]